MLHHLSEQTKQNGSLEFYILQTQEWLILKNIFG